MLPREALAVSVRRYSIRQSDETGRTNGISKSDFFRTRMRMTWHGTARHAQLTGQLEKTIGWSTELHTSNSQARIVATDEQPGPLGVTTMVQRIYICTGMVYGLVGGPMSRRLLYSLCGMKQGNEPICLAAHHTDACPFVTHSLRHMDFLQLHPSRATLAAWKDDWSRHKTHANAKETDGQ